jgi:phosphatidyl-myo-inositol dimannoside synthase
MHGFMKGLLLTSVFPPHVGGSGRWFWEVYRRLPREEVVIAAGAHPRAVEFDRTHNLNIARLPMQMPSWGVANWRSLRRYTANYSRLARLVRQQRIDQIHCGCLLPEGFWAWMLHRRFGIPYLCYVHGEEIAIMRQSRELTWMMNRVLGSAQMVIANSRNTCAVLQERCGVPADQIRLLYPGVDVDRFIPVERDAKVRKALGWDDRPVVLTVGRLQARKGQDRLILATKQLRESFPDLLYVIVGDGEERQRLEQLVRENHLENHVQFRFDSRDEELIHCYQQCDMFALPNREVNGDFEGFGMVLLEAEACGRPVIAGTSGGTAETMQVPATGRLVCCDRPEPLANLIAEMLSDRERLEVMGQAARRWVLENFDWRILSQQAYTLFQSMAKDDPHFRDDSENRLNSAARPKFEPACEVARI